MNFLALLGWSPGSTDQELFTRDGLIAAFDLGGISGGNAIFNPEKLDWFNQQHMLRLEPGELARRVRPSFEAADIWRDEYLSNRYDWFIAVLALLGPRAKKLVDFATLGRFFFVDPVEYDEAAVEKHLRAEGMSGHLEALDAAFTELKAFHAQSTEAALRRVADARGVKAAALIHATRVAITGRSVSPGLFEVAALLGRARTHARLCAAVRLIS